MTEQIGGVEPGERPIIDDPWDAIEYKGPDCLIAGGGGVTPYIAILREQQAQGALAGNTLIFSNKQERDIILRDEFEAMEGQDCLFAVTDEPDSPLARGLIDKAFLKRHVSDFSQPFYVCSPPKMVEAMTDALKELGVDPESVLLED